ncbi:hypothetical protein M6B38_247690 [Iris pallida]|uniref:Uncharacterized protein n=1 Tax=Iris pallida TaxID=29817 RepID=A0AAX6DG69_IRIPA|nr:hypothetical protein M6B38_247690 [Iris pallida]
MLSVALIPRYGRERVQRLWIFGGDLENSRSRHGGPDLRKAAATISGRRLYQCSASRMAADSDELREVLDGGGTTAFGGWRLSNRCGENLRRSSSGHGDSSGGGESLDLIWMRWLWRSNSGDAVRSPVTGYFSGGDEILAVGEARSCPRDADSRRAVLDTAVQLWRDGRTR